MKPLHPVNAILTPLEHQFLCTVDGVDIYWIPEWSYISNRPVIFFQAAGDRISDCDCFFAADFDKSSTGVDLGDRLTSRVINTAITYKNLLS